MKKLYESLLYSTIDEIKDNSYLNLMKNNVNQKNLINERENIIDSSINIKNLLEYNISSPLLKEDVERLIKINKINDDIKSNQEHELFLQGMKYGIWLVDKLDLKEENSK